VNVECRTVGHPPDDRTFLLPFPHALPVCPAPQVAMAETLQQQWQGVINTPTKAEAVQSLAEILAEHGSDFAKCLDHKAAQRCIEILDYVSLDLHFSPFTVSDGLVRASPRAKSAALRGTCSSPHGGDLPSTTN